MFKTPCYLRSLVVFTLGFLCALSSAFAQIGTVQMPVDVNLVYNYSTQRIDLGTLGVNQTIDDIVLQATGGLAPYTWTKPTGQADGLMPAGTSLSSNGVISGRPTTIQSSTGFKVNVTDSTGKATSIQFVLAVAAVEIPVIYAPGNCTTSPGVFYSKQLQAISGKKPYTWSTTATLPLGLSLNATSGVISGIPDSTSVNATANFRDYIIPVKLTTASNATDSDSFTLTVAKPFEWVTPANLPVQYGPGSGQATGPNCTLTIAVTGGKTPPYNFRLQTGSNLPPGLTLGNSTGTISGKPTANGNYAFTINSTDALGSVITRNFALEIIPYALAISGPAIGNGTQYAPIAPLQYSAISGSEPYRFTATNLPAGLSLNATTGLITGSLNGTAGTSNFTVTVTDNKSMTANATCVFTVNPGTPLSWNIDPLPPAGQVGFSYSANLSAATGGWAPYTYNATGLPTGLTFNATARRISITPTAAGNFSVNFTVTDSATPKNTVTQTLPITIAPYMTVSGPATVSGQQYTALNPVDFEVTGGNGTYTWSTVPSPIVPASLSINATTGIISGNLTAAPGNYTVAVNVKDSASRNATANLTITILPRPPLEWVTPSELPSGKVMDAYSENLTVSGGQPAYKFALKAGSTLPAGLLLNNSTGALTGKPTTPGNFTFTINASDSGTPVFSSERTFTISIAEYGMSINGPDLISGEQYTSITPATFSPVGGVGNFTWSATWSGNATALTINPTTGIASGNLTTGASSGNSNVGNYTWVVKLTDGQNQSTTKNVTVQIQPRAVSWVTDSVLAKGKVSFAYSTNVTASGGWGNITYALKSPSTLPPGLSLNATTGIISGTPTGNGTTNFTLIASDSALPTRNTVEQAFSITIDPMDPLVWTVDPTPVSGKMAFAYTAVLPAASGGSGNYSYSVNGTTLPPGLSFNATTRTISGTPTEAKTFNVSLTVRDSFGNATANATLANSSVQTIPITIEPYGMSISGPDSTSGDQYSSITPATFTPVGGEANYSWNATWSGNATALTINSATGILSGNLTTGLGSANSTVGNYTMIVSLRDGRNQTITKNVTVQIQPLVVSWITPGELPDGKELENYSQTLQVEGARAPYTFSLKTGSTLPVGLNLNNSTGVLSGKPTADGNYTFTIIAKDSSNPAANQAERTFTLSVAAYGLEITGPASATGQQYTALTPADFGVTGGASPFKWSVTPPLPTALSINASTGIVSGNLTAVPGDYPVTINVSDANSRNATANFTVTITPRDPVVWGTPEALPDGKELDAYSQNLTVSGGWAPYRFTLQSGTLPGGITLNATTGRLAGTANATSEGNYTFTVNATDSGNPVISALRTFTLSIKPYGLSVNGSAAISGQQYTAISPETYTASGGAAPYTWAVTGLPTTLSINATTGIVSGNLTATPGNYTANFTVTDNKSQTASKVVVVRIQDRVPLTWVTQPTLPDGKVQDAYSENLSVSGGKSPYTFATKNGSTLPLGLSLNATTGRLSGLPTTAGNYTFIIVASDTGAPVISTEQTFTLKVAPYGMAVTGPESGSGVQYSALTPADFDVTGGTAPHTWSVSGPAWISINATSGIVSGNLTAAPGNYTANITVTDNKSQTASKNFAITILPSQLDWQTPESLPNGKVSFFYTQNLSVMGGKPPYTFVMANGSVLPPGLSLNNSTGVISGRPTTASTSNFTITARDSGSPVATASRTFNLIIDSMPPLVWTIDPAPPNAKVAFAYSANLSAASGGSGNYTYLPSASGLPPGLTYNATTRTISGTGNASGNFNVSLTVRDNFGNATANATLSNSTVQTIPIFIEPYGMSINGTDSIVGDRYTAITPATFTPVGGNATYTWSSNSTTGLSINATSGILSGNLTAAPGNYTLVVGLSDGRNQTVSKNVTVQIRENGLTWVTQPPLPAGKVASPYTTNLTVTGGKPTYTYVLKNGSVLPTGLTLNNSTGIISGTPTSASVGGNASVIVVTTLAGGGSSGSVDGSGTSARFLYPSGIAVDVIGNVYVGDHSNHKIRKISPAGQVSTLAGSGFPGAGDGNGTSASFRYPVGIAVDGMGNVYVADTENHKIRKITPAGQVTTLAGSGSVGTGDGNGANASFCLPHGVAVDSTGNVYVADQGNHKIRKISPTGQVTTLAGSGSIGAVDGHRTNASFNAPSGLALDLIGNIYLADNDNHKIRKITPAGQVTTIAGSGAAGSVDGNGISASFNVPSGVAVDVSGNVFVSDYLNSKIRKITPTGQVTTLAGSGSVGSLDGIVTNSSFSNPYGVAIDGMGNVYAADQVNHKIRKISPANTFTVIASDSASPTKQTAEREFTLPIAPYGMSVNGTSTISGLQYSAITPTTFNAIGGTGNYTWSVNSTTALGLSINATSGIVSGNLTAAPGDYTMLVSVRDAANQTATANVSVTILPLTLSWISEPALPDGQVASAYSTNLTVNGGRPPYAVPTLASGALPPGMTINATSGITTGTFILSGTPSAPGNYTFTLNASDSAVPKNTANRTFTLSVKPYPMTLTGPDSITGQKFVPISPVQYLAANGTASYKWSMNSTVTGLSINATTGVVSGTPTVAAGNYTTNITVTDSLTPVNQSLTKTVSVIIQPVPALVWTTTSPLPPGQVAYAYTTNLTVGGGRPGYTYALSNGTLPLGLALNNSTGVISGTPTQVGTANFTITASDSDSPSKNTASRPFTLTIAPYGMTINGSDVISGQRYSTITPTPYIALNGTANYTWSANNTIGLSIDRTTGVVSGNLTAAPGNYTLPVSVLDGRNQTVTKNVTVSISQPDPLAWLTPEKLQGGRVALDYALTVAATGGKAPYTYVLKTGPLPTGLTLNSTTGLISGKPTTAATSNFTLTARDSANGTVDRTFNLVIEPYGMGIVGTSPIPGKVYQYFEYQFGVEGGISGYTWNATSTPAGLTMNATSGVLSGTPTLAGNSTTVIKVTDSKGQFITRTFNINISASDALSIVSGPIFGPVSINSTYTTTLQGLGGKPSYIWSIVGTKPASVNLSTTGLLTANSSTALTANFTVRVQDSAVPAANATKTMSVVFFNPATLVIATDALYTGWVGEEYSVQLGALGGTQPYDWAITSGTLPVGLNLSETGCIYGTPSASANATLTFRVTDAKGLTANKTLALTIQGKPGQVAASGKLFTDVTNAANLSLPEHYIIAVEDFDNDGREDLLATNSASNVVLMRGVGAFDFRDITANAGLNGVTPALVADFNNDGVSDILSVNLQRSEATLFFNNGQGVFTRQVLTGLLTGDLANYRDISYADVDGDGDLDLLFNINATTGGGVVAVFNQANISQATSPLFSGKSYLVKTTWKNAKFSVTDANGDGKQDIVVLQTNGAWPTDTHPNHPASLYLNTGNTTADYANATGAKTLAGFTEKPNCGITSANEMSAFTSLDIDNDGDLDLINGSSDWPTASVPHIYINDGTGTYTQKDSPILHGRFYHHGATVFDADLDGDQDAVWSALHVFSDVYPRMWENGATYLKATANGTLDPAKAFFDSTTAWGIDAKISGSGNMGSAGYAADLDADGDLDYIANLWSSIRTYKVYRNDSNLKSANWLKVELIGAVSPAQGTGARVEVELNNATAARPAQAATGSRYEIVIGSYTWQQAKMDAEKRGGHLVTMATEQEWNDVKALIAARGTTNTYWGGATDEVKSGDWKWIDGTAVTLSKWSASEPNEYFGPNSENHLQIYSDGTWNDLPSNYTLVGYICEYERPASTTANSKVAQYLGPETGAVTESSLTFGLADKTQAAKVTVYWPSGLRSILENVAGNRTIQIREADELPLPRPTEEGDVIAWGANPNGETTVPTTLGKVVQIVAGDASSAALLANGTVSVWGTNWAAQRNVPATLNNVVQIAAGNNHYLALTANGSVVAWGWNTANQTVVPATLRRAKFVAAGFNTSYAVSGDGRIVAWGGNDFGQANIPSSLVGVTSIAAGRGHALALKSDGTVVAWGRNDFGQATVPGGLTNVVQIAAGDYHSVALKNDGTVVAWGANWSAQATAPIGLANVVQISAKGDRSLALKADNSIVNWGINPDNSTPPPSPGQILSTAAGSKHTLGLVRKIQITISSDLPTGTEGQVIPETTFSATGGSGAYTWSVIGTLPPGMTLNATTGKLSGTPTTSGNYTFSVRATSGGRFSDRVVTMEVQKAIRNALWVATTGNDTTGNGTISKPYATITKAHTVANKGDLIKVLPGNYTESLVIEKAVEISSTAGPAQTIIRSASKASAVFCRGEGVKGGSLVGFTLTGGGGANNPGYNRYGGGFAINAPAGTTFEVKNCIIRNNSDAGITFGGGFHVTGGSTLKLTNSLVHSNAAWANGGAALIEGANLIADRCTIVTNTNNGFNRIGGISGAGNCNIQIKNSILWNNSTNQYGSFSSGPGGNATFTFSYSIVQGGTTATVGGNTKTLVNTGTGCLTSDPKFAETTNYTLGTGSPAINTGDPNAAQDADGSRADMGWDSVSACPDDDFDGDGVSNGKELTDQTNPRDASSFNPASKPLFAYLPFNEPTTTSIASIQLIEQVNLTNGSEHKVVANSIPYQCIKTIGNSLSVNGSGESFFALKRASTAQILENNNTYASFSLKVPQSSGLTSSGARIFSLRGGSQNIPVASVWIRDSNGTFQVGMQRSSQSIQWNGTLHSYNKPIFIIASYAWESPWGRPGGLHGFMMPPQDDLLVPGKVGVGTNASFWTYTYADSFLPTTASIVGTAGLQYFIDEIRVGDQWENTVPLELMVDVQGGTLPQSSALAGQQVQGFQVGKTEVTWGEWKTIRNWAVANGYSDLAGVGDTYPSGSPNNFPVVYVSWYDAVKWCNAKSQKENLTPVYTVNGTTYKTGQAAPTQSSSANGYRLPSEKEWEWAARGGVSSQGYTYSGSNDVNAVAWYNSNSSSGTKAVGTKLANELGIFDMSGNLWEWCWDSFMRNSLEERRLRGGGFSNLPSYISVGVREGNPTTPDTRFYTLGFRLACNSRN